MRGYVFFCLCCRCCGPPLAIGWCLPRAGAMALAPAGAVAHRLLGTKDDCFAFSKLIHMSGWYQICVAWNLREGIHLNGQSGVKKRTTLNTVCVFERV